MLNTYPASPWPVSTEQLHKGDNEDIQAEVTELQEDVSSLDNKVNGDATVYPYADAITIEDAVPSNLADCSVKIEPVQSGSGDPSPTNIRPITGHTEVDVQRDGVNLLDDSVVGLYQATVTQVERYGYAPFVLKAGTYTISYTTTNPATPLYITYMTDWSYAELSPSGTAITLTQDTEVFVRSGLAYTSSEEEFRSTYSNTQVQIGHIPTSFEPYQGKTYTIALGDTIYGGTVDFSTGVMTVDRAQIASYDGETIGEPWLSDRDVYAAGTTPTTGAQVVYTLATPLTVQLTPQQIQLIKGTNTLTASTGDISVTVNGVSGSIGAVQSEVNDHEERIETVESGLTTTRQDMLNIIGWDKRDNLFDGTIAFANSNVTDAGKINNGNQPVSDLYSMYLPSGDYTISYTDTTEESSTMRVVAYPNTTYAEADSSLLAKKQVTKSGNYSKTFTVANSHYILIQLKKSVTNVQVQKGSEATPYQPYRPVIGTAVESLIDDVSELQDVIPDAPTTDGAYVLTATVSSGTPTYSWVSATP